MAEPSTGDRQLSDERVPRQRRSGPRRLWETHFATNRPPGPSHRSPVFVALWALLAMASGIAGAITGDSYSALGFTLLALGLVLATLTNMVRDEFVRWVVPLNLLALAVLSVAAAILWSS